MALTRRERDKRKQRLERIRQQVRESERQDEQSLSQIFKNLDDIDPEAGSTLIFRVSSPQQRGDLAGQVLHCFTETTRRNIIVTNVHTFIGKGSDESLWEEALRLTKTDGSKNCIYESLDRAIRHPRFGGKDNYHLEPEEEQFQRFQQLCQKHGVAVATIQPVASSQEEVRSQQTKRGQQVKTKGGGHRKPTRLEVRQNRRTLLLPIVRKLRNDYGKSMGEIAHTLGLTKRTVQCYLAA